jgi:hypothetical protein
MQNKLTTDWRARHAAALAAVKAALPPGDPRRFAMLRQIDTAAVAIRAAERRKKSK